MKDVCYLLLTLLKVQLNIVGLGSLAWGSDAPLYQMDTSNKSIDLGKIPCSMSDILAYLSFK